MLETVGQLVEFGEVVIVAVVRAHSFPDVLLRVEVRGRGRKSEDLQAWFGAEDALDGLAAMPGGAVPQQENGLRRVSGQQPQQISRRRVSIHELCAHHGGVTGHQVERPKEVRTLASRVEPGNGCLTPTMPDHRQGRLQIQGRFIAGQENGVRCVLGGVNQFFSSASSKAITACSLQDL